MTGQPVEPDVALKHLIVVPGAGICNRFRAIASAVRLSTINKFKCTVAWEWSDFHIFVAPYPDVDWIPDIPRSLEKSCHQIRHLLQREGGTAANRRIPLTKYERIIVRSPFIFNALEESAPLEASELKAWLPRPSDFIASKVKAFRDSKFRDTVGIHIRRTDHQVAIANSPDELFIREIARLIDQGHTILLATDNHVTEKMMVGRFGNKIIIYPKNPNWAKRWPRHAFVLEETIDDVVDFFLLASCEFVIGCVGSSFSTLAMIYNGSDRCRLLKADVGCDG